MMVGGREKDAVSVRRAQSLYRSVAVQQLARVQNTTIRDQTELPIPKPADACSGEGS